MGSCDLDTAKTTAAVAQLLLDIWTDAYGLTSPSVYETARVAVLAPWLTGHSRRLGFLLDSQHPDGSWGGQDGYGLVPTLSATEALLANLRRWNSPRYADAVRSADRGLRTLFGWLGNGRPTSVPDTVAVEIIVPALVLMINAHLDGLATEPLPGLDTWRGTARLTLPDGMDYGTLTRLRDMVRQGHGLPDKLLHSLEVIGPPVRGASFVKPVRGAVGCSPASTAAWLGEHPPSVDYLEAVQARHGGPVPVGTPITVFERAWVLATLATAGITLPVPAGLVDSLHAAFGEYGAAVGPGLLPDADDTATALHALAQWGSPRSPSCLWTYRAGPHFSCFPGERTPSTSTNAHVLQAFGSCATPHSPYRDVIRELSEWLCGCQEPDGSWTDKWHASPYYATVCCATALASHGGTAESAAALRKAVEWVLATQRADGSWGRWAGTYEETAYAVQILLRTRVPDVVGQAAARGCAFLLAWEEEREHPPLWHDKDLYTPIRIVRAEGLAALHLGRMRIPAQSRQPGDSYGSRRRGAVR
jgi:halimadienyl-diphosphate synthase